MSETTPALDEAFERMAAASFELPNGFVNHGAMACEALAKLGPSIHHRRSFAPVAAKLAALGGGVSDEVIAELLPL